MTALTCQRCNGLGTIGPVHCNRGDLPHEWRILKCDGCGGSGYWTAQQAVAARNGEQQRQERIERGESLMQASRRLGISPAQLSATESGRARPSPEDAK